MHHTTMKIKPCFLNLIKAGKKKHEYRLNTPDRRELSIGDKITLVNNTNPEDTFEVVITDITTHKDWYSALKDYWQEDFGGLYDNLYDLLNECSSFYSSEQVKEYGIIRFEIKPCLL